MVVFLSLIIQPTYQSENYKVQAKGEESIEEIKEKGKPKIVREEIALRSEYSKTFLRSDGSYQQVSYMEPIHIKKNGVYQNIDNRLKKEGSRYTNKNGKYTIMFGNTMEQGVLVEKDKKADNLLFYLDSDEDFVQTNIENRQEVPEVSKTEEKSVSSEGISYKNSISNITRGEITYLEEETRTQILYETSSNKIKESIVFPQKEAVKRSCSFQLKTKSLKAKQYEDGSIVLYKKNKDNYEYKIETPYLYDSSTEASYTYDVRTELKKNSEGYQITYYLPESWLENEERVYPVTLDPTVYLDNAEKYIDTYITAKKPNTNYKGADIANIEKAGEGGYLFRPFEYPSGDVAIINARLVYFMCGYPPSDSYKLGVKKVTSDWNSDVTWNTRPSVEDEWLDYGSLGLPGSLDITSVIQDYSKNLHNYGVMISGIDSSGAKIYTSKSSRKPFLVTTYKPLSKDEKQLNFRTFYGGKAGTVYANEFNGRIKFIAEDIGINSNRMPVSICRVHTSNGTKNVGFGGYFRTNYHQKLSYDATYNIFTFIDGVGDIHYLKKTQAGCAESYVENEDSVEYIEAENTVWEDEQGIGYQLEYPFGTAETKYDKMKMTTPQGEELQFNSTGNLTSITESMKQKKNSSVTITYKSGDYIDKIVDGIGRTYVFKYNSNNYISSICYLGTGTNTLKEVKYSYTSGIESSITVIYPNGKKSIYDFIYGKFLTGMKNPSGAQLKFTYDYPSSEYGKLETVSEYGNDGTLGDKISYAYQGYRTTVADRNSNIEIYEFDNTGRVTCVRNKEGKAVLADYDETDGRLLGVSELRFTGYGENLLQLSGCYKVSSGNETVCTDITSYTHDDTIPVLSGKTYMKLPTDPETTLKQQFTCEGDFKAGITYSFGGWMKGKFQKESSSKDAYIQFTAIPKDSTKQNEVFIKRPNYMVSDWQYFLKECKLSNDCKKIVVDVFVRNQINPVYTSQIECKKSSLYSTTESPAGEEVTDDSEYDEYGNTISTIRDGVKYKYFYNDYGKATRENVSCEGETLSTSSQYNEDLLLAERTDDAGNTVKYTYDDENQLKTIAYPDGMYDKYSYDEDGSKSSHSTFSSEGVKLGENKYSYLDNGLLKEIDSKNGKYTFSYNSFGDLLSANVGTKELLRYEYKSNSNRILSKVVYGNESGNGKDTILYTYNSNNQVVTCGDFRYTYDEEGQVSSIVNEKSNSYKIWENGILRACQRKVDEYTYQSEDDVVTFKIGNDEQKVTSSNDKDVTVNNNGIASLRQSVKKDGLGRVEDIVVEGLHNSNKQLFKQVFQYQNKDAHETTTRVSEITTTINNVEKTEKYSYDACGRLTSIGDASQDSITYSYDSLGQITRENNSQNHYRIDFSYDNKGNILKKSSYDYAETGTTLKLQTYEYEDSNWGDLLTKFDGKDITYDSIGNPVNYLGKTLSWEKGRQLTSVKEGDKDISFQYDEEGVRTSKLVDGETTSYVYADEKLIYMRDADNQMMFAYDASGKPLSMKFNGVYYVFQCNFQGDVVGIIDANGYKVATYTYDAYGRQTSPEPESLVGKMNPLRYRGYIYDKETGWYYLMSRYYNPEVGRFLNADDSVILSFDQNHILQSNLFAYCLNDPVNAKDSGGNVSDLIKMNYNSVCFDILINPKFFGPIIDFGVFFTGRLTSMTPIAKKTAPIRKNIYDIISTKVLSDCPIAKAYFDKAIKGGEVSKDKENQLKKLILSYEDLNKKIKKFINKYKKKKKFTKKINSFEFSSDSDLYYTIQHADIEVTGVKRSDGKWKVTLLVMDRYDFSHLRLIRDGFSPGNLANDGGFILSSLGDIKPYEIRLRMTKIY